MGALGVSALALRLVRARGRSESAVPIYFRSAAPSSTALEALHLADMQLEEAAAKIAGAGASSLDGSNVDLVDLSTEIVALMSAQSLFEANLTTPETASQVQKGLIDTTA